MASTHKMSISTVITEEEQRSEQEQKRELTELFQMIDSDGDGIISVHELQSVLDSLGLYPSLEELQSLLASNPSGMTYSEFMTLMSTKSGPTLEEEMRETFETFDRNADGYITRDELKQVMMALGQRFTDEEINRMICEADTDGDSQISFEEFLKLNVGE